MRQDNVTHINRQPSKTKTQVIYSTNDNQKQVSKKKHRCAQWRVMHWTAPPLVLANPSVDGELLVQTYHLCYDMPGCFALSLPMNFSAQSDVALFCASHNKDLNLNKQKSNNEYLYIVPTINTIHL